jgi:hypothetical protein
MKKRIAAFLTRPFLFQRPSVEETGLDQVWSARGGAPGDLVFSRRRRRDRRRGLGRNCVRALFSMRAGVSEQLGSEVADQ